MEEPAARDLASPRSESLPDKSRVDRAADRPGLAVARKPVVERVRSGPQAALGASYDEKQAYRRHGDPKTLIHCCSVPANGPEKVTAAAIARAAPENMPHLIANQMVSRFA